MAALHESPNIYNSRGDLILVAKTNPFFLLQKLNIYLGATLIPMKQNCNHIEVT